MGEYSGGPGDVGGTIAFTNEQSQIIEFCTPFYSSDANECQDVAGYVNYQGQEHQICNDDKNRCEAEGGTYGVAATGGDMQTAVCLPPDFADDLPTCDIKTLHVVAMEGTDPFSGGFVCSAPENSPPKHDDPTNEIPGINKPDPGDPGGPGDPDSGAPDGEGPGEGDTPEGDSNVTGGGSCTSAPNCRGDAIQCAIHYQSWKARCASENLTESVNESENPGEIDKESEFTTLIDTGLDAITGTGEQGVDTQANALGDVVTGLLPSAGSCSDPVISFFGKGQVVLSCSKLADFRDILGWMLYILTAYYLFNLAMKPIESKV